MTQEEKAKRYDEAIEELRGLLEGIREEKCKILEEDIISIFPELQENEDEEIRKGIIRNLEYLMDSAEGFVKDELKERIAWLEKQGDKDELIKELGEYKAKYTQEVLEKHLRVMNKDDERLRKTTISFLKDFADKGYENAVECIDWLEKQSERKSQGKTALEAINEEKIDNKFCIKPAEWSEEYIADVFEKVGLAKIVREQSNDALTIALQDAMIELSKVTLQQKPAWSEDDELHIRELESLVKQVWATAEHENDKDTIHKMSNLSFFLKTLKPQLKQEWSEEDENLLKLSFENLTELKDRYGEEYGKVGDCISWLKSLKQRYTWKPSDEQMDALQYVCRNLNPPLSDKLGWDSLKTLELFYKILKKLY